MKKSPYLSLKEEREIAETARRLGYSTSHVRSGSSSQRNHAVYPATDPMDIETIRHYAKTKEGPKVFK